MKDLKLKLLIEQLDRKFEKLSSIDSLITPSEGWIYAIRTALKMNLRQLGAKLNITAQSVKEIELREKNGAITLSSLKEVGNALDMRLIYGFIPKEKTLNAMIERRAFEIAELIVLRTSTTMNLENQLNSTDRIKQAIEDMADEIKREMPKYLWD
ncbi:MAG: mobile mystery protein A [Bacteroidetes bacterium]|nr:MAG: mobile mystery protein A [Bacteroidota bacterium]